MLDSMCRQMSTKAASRRWPLAVFYNILDMAGVNAWIIFVKATESKLSRRKFLFKLAEELIGCTAVDSDFQQPANQPHKSLEKGLRAK